MEKNKVKLKYHLNLWRTLPSYPTQEDILYEIYSFLLKDGKKEFSDIAMNYIWKDEEGNPNWKGTAIEDQFNKLIERRTIKKVNKEGAKTERSWYKIHKDKNPFV